MSSVEEALKDIQDTSFMLLVTLARKNTPVEVVEKTTGPAARPKSVREGTRGYTNGIVHSAVTDAINVTSL